MGFGLWRTLLRPDEEELQNQERTEVGRAANHLQVGEFQVLQLAYREWHGKDLPEEIVDRLFHDYMIHNEVPHWARHYARQINRLGDLGRVDENDPRFHRYDHNYVTHVPNGVKHFVIAAGCICFFLVGSIWAAEKVARKATSMLPPYFDEKELSQKPKKEAKAKVFDGFGRADKLHPRTGP